MYPPPAGRALTREQARELDDTFLSSNPLEYFRSRIAALLVWQELAPTGEQSLGEPPRSSIRAEFNRYLQRPVSNDPFHKLDVHAQVAADSLSVRHHTAEALLRLTCALLEPKEAVGAPCLWAAVTAGPKSIEDVISRLGRIAETRDLQKAFFDLCVPPQVREAARRDAQVVNATNVFAAWLDFAASLLTPASIDLQAASNKVKHGLAVRARADMRVTFTTHPPNASGDIPLSALTGRDAVNIFDQPVLEVLAQGPKVGGHRQGLELTQLRLKPSAILAHAFMIAMTHGAMFHVAAVEHFNGRDDLDETVAPPDFPGFPVGGPLPDNIDGSAPLGLRFPLTEPPGGGPAARVAGVGFPEYFQTFNVNYGSGVRGRVVDG